MSFADELRSLTKGIPHPEVEVNLFGLEETCRKTAQIGLYMVLIPNFGLNPSAQKLWKDKYGLTTRTYTDGDHSVMIEWFPSKD